jgi:hypothetical protein
MYIDSDPFYGPDGQVILATQGTTLTNPAHWKANLRNASNQHSILHQRAVDLAIQLDAQFADSLTFTGHSLGGGIATAQALATGRRAFVFNPAGLSQNAAGRSLEHWSRADKLVTRYIVDGDVVDRVNQLDGLPDSLGRRVDISSSVLDKILMAGPRALTYLVDKSLTFSGSNSHVSFLARSSMVRNAALELPILFVNTKNHLISTAIDRMHVDMQRSYWGQ